MDDKDLNQLRKSIFGDVEKRSTSSEKAEMFQSLFGDLEPEPVPAAPPAPAQAPVHATPEPAEPEFGSEEQPGEPAPQEEISPEDLEVMNLREIKMMISRYRLLIAQGEKRIKDLRYKLSGLETEYRALMGETDLPAPAPQPCAPATAPDCASVTDEDAEQDPETTATLDRFSSTTPKPRQKLRSWDDAHSVTLEEAAWRILLDEGKSMPPWRVAAAIRRRGVKRQFTEDALVGEVRRSKRLGISGGGHVHIR